MQEHWDSIYSEKAQKELGWYQDLPQPDLELILDLDMPKQSRIVLAGCGTTTLVDHLVKEGYTNLVLVDISTVALQKIRDRFANYNFEYIEVDLGSKDVYQKIHGMAIELWYDRATLHFLLQDQEIENYRETIALLEPNYVILAQFSTRGVKKCSGLDVKQYDQKSLRAMVNHHYSEVVSREFTYNTPSGQERLYIYGVYNLVFDE